MLTGSNKTQEPATLLFSIALISACALSYEILLMRLLSIIQWHHFAYMIISLALLGYGISGTFLSVIKDHVASRFGALYTANAILFAISTVACFALAQHTPFNGLELIWDPWQFAWLILVYLLLCIPFFFAANCFGLAFIHFRNHIYRIYRWDLLGAGIGALGIIALLFLFHPTTCLKLIACAGLLSAIPAIRTELGAIPRVISSLVLIGAAALFLVWPSSWLELQTSQFKGLAKTLQINGTEIIEERSGPLGLLTVVRSSKIPFRHAPGLSLMSRVEPPTQLGVFTDGDGMTAITHYTGSRENLSYLDEMSSALAYHLIDEPQVLVLGAGGGADVLQALYHQATTVDAVELNPQMVELVREDYAEFAGKLYSHPRVKIHVSDARAYLAKNQQKFNLIQISMLESFASSGAGTHALSESYLYTVEALQATYSHLEEDGLIAITRWLKLPPRDSLKLFATAMEVLNRSGVIQPAQQLIVIRSWQTSTLLIKNGTFSSTDIEKVQRFCEARSFDVAFHPGISPSQTNRYNILDHGYLYQGTTALLSDRHDGYLEEYKFNLRPSTDNQPYFFHFFKWSLLPELFALRDQGSLIFLDSGYLILVTTLLQAVPICIVLILLPLVFLPANKQTLSRDFWRPGLYFLCLGLGFLFIEIAFIQRFILFVSHPLYAAALILSGFLVFAGLGSGYSTRIEQWAQLHKRSAVNLSIMGLATLSLIYLVVLPTVLAAGMGLNMIVKGLIAISLIAPLAFFMGMPFPLGLTRLANQTPSFIPWAWGINGCASVLSAIMATVIAIHYGFQTVILLAVILYAAAARIWR
ncbi:MAG: SAM-dependent methyltransferase [Gammaproteobacteria bacterium]|nr:SAM-dependent methyltransferase [Gammaproteobacteria bacterium]